MGGKGYQNTLIKFSNDKKEVALVEKKKTYHSKRRGSLFQSAGCEWVQEELVRAACGSANAIIQK